MSVRVSRRDNCYCHSQSLRQLLQLIVIVKYKKLSEYLIDIQLIYNIQLIFEINIRFYKDYNEYICNKIWYKRKELVPHIKQKKYAIVFEISSCLVSQAEL